MINEYVLVIVWEYQANQLASLFWYWFIFIPIVLFKPYYLRRYLLRMVST